MQQAEVGPPQIPEYTECKQICVQKIGKRCAKGVMKCGDSSFLVHFCLSRWKSLYCCYVKLSVGCPRFISWLILAIHIYSGVDFMVQILGGIKLILHIKFIQLCRCVCRCSGETDLNNLTAHGLLPVLNSKTLL